MRRRRAWEWRAGGEGDLQLYVCVLRFQVTNGMCLKSLLPQPRPNRGFPLSMLIEPSQFQPALDHDNEPLLPRSLASSLPLSLSPSLPLSLWLYSSVAVSACLCLCRGLSLPLCLATALSPSYPRSCLGGSHSETQDREGGRQGEQTG